VIRPQAPSQGHVRYSAAVRVVVVVVEPDHWPVNCTSAAAKQAGRAEEEDSLGRFHLARFLTETGRCGGKLGAPGDSQGDLVGG
jgi:hypothetical protein